MKRITIRTSKWSFAQTAMAFVLILFFNGVHQPSLASSINYGDFFGDDVTFRSVVEDSRTDPAPLFGAPLATSNSLSFSPTAFASASQGGIADVTDSQLRMTIEAKSNETGITFVVIDELGDFTLEGPPDGIATAKVGAAMIWTVLEVNGEPLPGPLPRGQAKITFDNGAGEFGGEFALPDDVGAAHPWSGKHVIDLTDFLLENQIDGVATKVEFTMNNSLSTFADAQSAAHIKKKEAQQVTITAIPNLMPEPAAGEMLIPVLLFVAMRRRNRSKVL